MISAQQAGLLEGQMKTEMVLKLLAQSLSEGRIRCLSELSQFRANPLTIIPHLKQRIPRYRKLGNNEFLFSKVHKKKALQQKENQNQRHIHNLIEILEQRRINLQQLTIVPRLNEIASKLCLIIMKQMSDGIQVKHEYIAKLRQILNEDTEYSYPHSITCLVALTFDQPYESLMSLLLDNGIPKRPNRMALLDQRMKYAGVASMVCLNEKQFQCTVYVLTDQIIPKQHNSIPSSTSIENIQNNSDIMRQPFNSSVSNVSNSQSNRKEQNMNNFMRPPELNGNRETGNNRPPEGYNANMSNQRISFTNLSNHPS